MLFAEYLFNHVCENRVNIDLFSFREAMFPKTPVRFHIKISEVFFISFNEMFCTRPKVLIH